MKKFMLSLIALAALTACGGQETEQSAGAAETGAAPAAAPAAPAASGAVTDPQIADIVVAANELDIRGGEMAQSKAASPQVKEFAQRMITDHTGVNKAATDLVTRLGVTPEPNPLSQQIRQEGEQNQSRLQGLTGAEFDRAYIDSEVNYHEALLDVINNMLIPAAQNAELKTLLQQTVPAVEAHLQHAKQLQSSLGKS